MRCLKCNKRIRNKRADAVYCSPRCRVADHRAKRNRRVTDNSGKTILSICDYSGVWSEPYKTAGYDVLRIDIKHGQDIRLMTIPGKDIYGILAAPPCTCFARAGMRWKRTDTQMIEALSVVDACLRFVVACQPKFWALENPTGRLKHYLGEPAFYFDPCDFGDPYTKRTCLWGEFNKPKPSSRVKPITTAPGHHSIDQYLLSRGHHFGSKEKKALLRSITPEGFARAFFEVNR